LANIDFRAQAGCGSMLGYLLGRPMEADNLLALNGLVMRDPGALTGTYSARMSA